jgi:hypothetical protein
MKAYWFEPADGVLGYNDGRKPEVGKSHSVKCEPVLCSAGLHGSVRAVDALQYAQSSRLWLVDITGKIEIGKDKICGQCREYLAVADVELVLREFARKCALDVIHLWDAPQIVRDYLESGDDSLRAAAWDAARAAARDAARAAAWAAAWDAAWDVAWAAARAAAWDVAWAAARAAAWDVAWAAARAAAWDAAWDAQANRLEFMLTKMFV